MSRPSLSNSKWMILFLFLLNDLLYWISTSHLSLDIPWASSLRGWVVFCGMARFVVGALVRFSQRRRRRGVDMNCYLSSVGWRLRGIVWCFKLWRDGKNLVCSYITVMPWYWYNWHFLFSCCSISWRPFSSSELLSRHATRTLATRW